MYQLIHKEEYILKLYLILVFGRQCPSRTLIHMKWDNFDFFPNVNQKKGRKQNQKSLL